MEWLTIPNYSSYEANANGDIRNKKTKKLLTLDVRSDGYGYIGLKPDKEGWPRVIRVHRLIAATFLGECPSGYSVDHMDRNPKNNAISNLRYASHKEQRKNSSNKGVSFKRTVELLKEGLLVRTFPSGKEAYEYLGLSIGIRGFYRLVATSSTIGEFTVRYSFEPDLEGELWKPVVGFSETHLVSNLGRVRTKGGRLILQSIRDGYYRVSLNGSGKKKKCSVHRLVAEAFIGSGSEELIVNHIDGNKTNNKAENLNWMTKSENSLHAIALGLRKKRKISE